MSDSEILHTIALKQCKNIGNANYKKMLASVGSTEEIWSNKKSLLGINGIGKQTIEEIGKSEFIKNAANEIEFCKKNDIKILLATDPEFPYLLSNSDDAPSLLYYKGVLKPEKTSLSIVGTRKMTSYGKSFIAELLSKLSKNNITTVSGLALGVDTTVHEESINNNIPTIAVMGQSLDKIYPSSNKNLSKKILDSGGALISEYATFDGTAKEFFLQRNRIIAAMSQSLIIVESAFGGGSITTVNYANQYNRDVYALPGKISDKYSQGCNQLIAQNKAECIVDTNSLLQNLFADIQPKLFSEPKKTKVEFSEDKLEHKYVFDVISSKNSIHLDEIADLTKIPHHKLLTILLDLEIFGHITSLSGKKYALE